ncbi:MAG: PQQ-dependent sugar dehydrogenase [Chitinophagales bacterium]|nr:PQQ-dependent sugar dehydrogenase [Chitinophagales bacterium]
MRKNCLLLVLIVSTLCLTAQVASINLVQIANGYSSPVDIKNCGDDRLFIVEQAGYIYILNKNGTKQTTPFLNIQGRVNSAGNEQGLLSLAFSPNYKQDGFFYVNYINGAGAGSTRISRFSVLANDSTQADPNSEVVLLTFTQPYTNHNGATLMFGKDGYLYDSQGDGGSGGDPQGYAQNKNTLLGKMLRLDVSNPDTTYTIPPNNPFVGQANSRGEIWAYGLRNPWRCSFDRVTGDMWMGDVGQDNYEEVDFQSAASAGGENYGWRCREGLHVCPNCITTGCASTGFIDPVFEYGQVNGNCSMTGGYVYRGAQYAKLFGSYINSDFCSGRFWATHNNGNNTFYTDSPLVYVNGVQTFPTNNVGSFGEDNNGELYMVGRANGRIYRLTETSDCKPAAFISFADTITGCQQVTIAALRGDTLSYQWYSSSGSISAATSYQYAATQSGWYKVKVSKARVGCEAFSDSVYVVVKDSTAITASQGQLAFCRNDEAVSLNSYLLPSGGTFIGDGITNNMFYPALSLSSNPSVQYSYVNNEGCVSKGYFQLQVNDTTALQKNPLDSVYCISSSPFSLSGFYNVSGQYSGNGVSNNDTIFNPVSAGLGNAPVSFLFENNSGCISNASFTLEVVGPNSLIKNVTDSIACDNEGLVSLSAFIAPAGGVYSGIGVNGQNFDPSVAPLGSNKIYYAYTNQAGCVSQDSFALQVENCTGINFVTANSVFRVYPNPASKGIYLDINVARRQLSEVTISSAVGTICYKDKLLLQTGQQVSFIDISKFAKGVYAVRLQGEQGASIQTIVVE